MITYRLNRWFIHPQGIIGDLYRMDELLCFTLEPPFQAEHGAIPEGEYPLSWAKSPRLKKFTPRVNNVPQRAGILLHAGNSVQDTEGCILLGTHWDSDKTSLVLESSRKATNMVYRHMEEDLSNGGYAELIITKEPYAISEDGTENRATTV